MVPKEFVLPSSRYPAALLVPAGGEIGLEIRCLPRGQVDKLRVVQIDPAQPDRMPAGADLAGFSYCLYNTKAACPVGSNPSAAALAAGVDEAAYRVSPVIVVPSGQAAFTTADGFPRDGISNLRLAYQCLDDHRGTALAATPSNTGRSLFLKIAAGAGGSATKQFVVALTVLAPAL